MDGKTAPYDDVKFLYSLQEYIHKKPSFYRIFRALKDFYDLRELLGSKKQILKFAKEKFFFDVYYNYKFIFEALEN